MEFYFSLINRKYPERMDLHFFVFKTTILQISSKKAIYKPYRLENKEIKKNIYSISKVDNRHRYLINKSNYIE